jgi:hypothetical protein
MHVYDSLMDVNPFRPTDERGVPKRFRGHGEALVWIASSLVKLYGQRILLGLISAVAAWLVWRATQPVLPGFVPDPFPTGGLLGLLIVAGLMLVIWLVTAVVIYVYVALAGGVLRRDERERAFPYRTRGRN